MVALIKSVTIGSSTYPIGTDHTAMPVGIVDQIRNPAAWAGGVVPPHSNPNLQPPIKLEDLRDRDKLRVALGVDDVVTGNYNESITLVGTDAGGPDNFDSTSRLTVQSYQTNGSHNYGEGLRLDLLKPIAKNMIAWRMPYPVGSTDMSTIRSVVWCGAHYYAQDQVDINNPTDVHGHWSVEVPDAGQALRTRFEVKFVNSSGAIGIDKTLVQTSAADLVVDTSNGQCLRLRSGAGAAKQIEFGNEQWGTMPRWRVGMPSGNETGGNVGGDFEIRRFGDNNSTAGAPITILRSSGRTTIGGTDGSQSGLDVRRSASGSALVTYNTATGGTAYAATLQDAATSRALQCSVQGESNLRAVLYGDGKLELGDGNNVRDTNLYRKAANQLATDDALFVGNVSAPGTPTGGVVIYAEAGALKVKNTAGVVTTLAAA